MLKYPPGGCSVSHETQIVLLPASFPIRITGCSFKGQPLILQLVKRGMQENHNLVIVTCPQSKSKAAFITLI